MENRATLRNLNLLADYTEQLRSHPRLTYLFFELTEACNLCCAHCGSWASPECKKMLTFAQVRRVLDRVAQAYPPQQIMICLTGGEPLLHPAFLEIVTYARSLGFHCGVTTNGTLITPEYARRLRESRIDSVTVSLDGLRAQHNRLRRRPWAFDQAVEGIRNLVSQAGDAITTQVTTVVHRDNFPELEKIFDLVTSLGVHSWRVVNIEPIGRALDHADLLLTPEELQHLLLYIREKRFDPHVQMDVTYGCSHYLTPRLENMTRDGYFICGSGVYVASILCNGDIYSCLDIERRPELVQGNIETDDFIDVWENRFQIFRMDRTQLCQECMACEDRRYCRGDSAHTWDYDRNQPLLCVKKMLSTMKEEPR